jgi:hypothetical protein
MPSTLENPMEFWDSSSNFRGFSMIFEEKAKEPWDFSCSMDGKDGFPRTSSYLVCSSGDSGPRREKRSPPGLTGGPKYLS